MILIDLSQQLLHLKLRLLLEVKYNFKVSLELNRGNFSFHLTSMNPRSIFILVCISLPDSSDFGWIRKQDTRKPKPAAPCSWIAKGSGIGPVERSSEVLLMIDSYIKYQRAIST